ncbi:TPA: hypothetical protein NJ475_004451 [Vibrio parahaemolyticus]|nr:hypothetical protein [Vibrio parahaemolyticus]
MFTLSIDRPFLSAPLGHLQQAELKERFEQGLHKEAIIVSSENRHGYHLLMRGRGHWIVVTSARKKREPKLFKSLDAAASAAIKIGFTSIGIEL